MLCVHNIIWWHVDNNFRFAIFTTNRHTISVVLVRKDEFLGLQCCSFLSFIRYNAFLQVCRWCACTSQFFTTNNTKKVRLFSCHVPFYVYFNSSKWYYHNGTAVWLRVLASCALIRNHLTLRKPRSRTSGSSM